MDAGDADLVEVGGLPHLLDVIAVGVMDRNVVTDDLRGRVKTTLACLKVCSLDTVGLWSSVFSPITPIIHL